MYPLTSAVACVKRFSCFPSTEMPIESAWIWWIRSHCWRDQQWIHGSANPDNGSWSATDDVLSLYGEQARANEKSFRARFGCSSFPSIHQASTCWVWCCFTACGQIELEFLYLPPRQLRWESSHSQSRRTTFIGWRQKRANFTSWWHTMGKTKNLLTLTGEEILSRLGMNNEDVLLPSSAMSSWWIGNWECGVTYSELRVTVARL